MASAYSADMRQRVIARVESGASRREAAEYDGNLGEVLSPDWPLCPPRGGSTPPLEMHAGFLLALIEVEPDLTPEEVICAMRKHKIPGSRTAVWRSFQRHKITFKKACAQPSRSVRTSRERADAGCANKACSIQVQVLAFRTSATEGW
jgi:hypothetical protein